jgi:hypothetical protein
VDKAMYVTYHLPLALLGLRIDNLPAIVWRRPRKGRCCRESSALVSFKRSTQGPSVRPKALKVPQVLQVPRVPRERVVLLVPQEQLQLQLQLVLPLQQLVQGQQVAQPPLPRMVLPLTPPRPPARITLVVPSHPQHWTRLLLLQALNKMAKLSKKQARSHRSPPRTISSTSA